MPIFTRVELEALLAPQKGPCVSLFMPTHRYHPGTEQDAIRFKNLLRSAEKRLLETGSSAAAKSLIEPLTSLGDREFWQHQMEGLALFASEAGTIHYRFPMALPELDVVADRFYVTPLLRFLQVNRRYAVLAISQNRVALYEGTASSVGPVDLRGLPSSLTDALGIEQSDRFLNLHSTGTHAAAPVFHGHGAPADSMRDDLVRFLRAIDRSLYEELRDDPVPLILAGVGYYFPIYRDVSRYPHLVEEGIEGNFDQASPEDLHAKAWPIASRVFRAREDAALEAYAKADSRRVASAELTTIARCAVSGRVRSLLLEDGASVPGTFDSESGEAHVSDGAKGVGTADILDDVAHSVMSRGGEVIVVARGRLPRGVPAAAILRF